MATEQNLWLFNWKGGGYHSVFATSKEKAIEVIKSGKFCHGGTPELAKEVDWNTLRPTTGAELNALASEWASRLD